MKAILAVIILLLIGSKHDKVKYPTFWVCNREEMRATTGDGLVNGYLEICSKSATWEVFSNQLYLTFEHKLKGDTLLLIYKNNDVGRGFRNFKHWPIVNKPFAKLYSKSIYEINVIYLNKVFLEEIKQNVKIPIEEKKLIFPDKLFLNNIQKPSCQE